MTTMMIMMMAVVMMMMMMMVMVVLVLIRMMMPHLLLLLRIIVLLILIFIFYLDRCFLFTLVNSEGVPPSKFDLVNPKYATLHHPRFVIRVILWVGGEFFFEFSK